jgi:ribosomal protein S18 acetylase RimI-like enzyme
MVKTSSIPGVSSAIRRASEADAEGIIAILEGIASERIYIAINKPWSADQQRQYLHSLSAREAVHIAVDEREGIIGYQTLELWAPTLDSMAHVGQIGTFLRPAWRRRGIGEALFDHTAAFARERDYLKFVIQVRSANASAQRFYRRLGFRAGGRLTRQVRIDGQEEDEIIMEMFR